VLVVLELMAVDWLQAVAIQYFLLLPRQAAEVVMAVIRQDKKVPTAVLVVVAITLPQVHQPTAQLIKVLQAVQVSAQSSLITQAEVAARVK
jgi:hypothetical protein